jgi:hypothetical protein
MGGLLCGRWVPGPCGPSGVWAWVWFNLVHRKGTWSMEVHSYNSQEVSEDLWDQGPETPALN